MNEALLLAVVNLELAKLLAGIALLALLLEGAADRRARAWGGPLGRKEGPSHA